MKPVIAHILPFPGIGGTEIATLRLAKAADTNGFASVMFCLNETVEQLFGEQGFRTVRYGVEEPSYRHPSKYWRNSRALARKIAAENPAVIHGADVLAAYNISLAALLARRRLVCHVRNRADTVTARERGFMLPVSRYVFVSQHTRQTFGLKIPDSRATVLYDGVDPKPELTPEARQDIAAGLRREFGIPANRKLVGTVARLAPQKDFATLALAAAEVVKQHDACFIVVGDYQAPIHREVYDQTRSMLESLGIADRFVFTGFRSDVPSLVAAFDIFVLSTHYEGFPLVLLEAMADGRPVAATAVDGVPEVVIQEKTGLLNGLKDHARLAANLSRLLGDEAFAARLGRSGRELVGSQFSHARYEEQVGAFYRSLLKG